MEKDRSITTARIKLMFKNQAIIGTKIDIMPSSNRTECKTRIHTVLSVWPSRLFIAWSKPRLKI